MILHPHEAKRRRVCCRCGGPSTLAQRTDGTGTPRAINWCFACACPAFAGASFERVDEPRLSLLPVVEYKR